MARDFAGKRTEKGRDAMLRIAVYGKGGIGKSTTVSNLAAVLALRGYTVMQIGCDPKADSTYVLMHGERIPSVLDLMRKAANPTLEDAVHRGFAGVLCVEAGGPTPGTGCAGRGVITAFEQLAALACLRGARAGYRAVRRAGRCGVRRLLAAAARRALRRGVRGHVG